MKKGKFSYAKTPGEIAKGGTKGTFPPREIL